MFYDRVQQIFFEPFALSQKKKTRRGNLKTGASLVCLTAAFENLIKIRTQQKSIIFAIIQLKKTPQCYTIRVESMIMASKRWLDMKCQSIMVEMSNNSLIMV